MNFSTTQSCADAKIFFTVLDIIWINISFEARIFADDEAIAFWKSVFEANSAVVYAMIDPTSIVDEAINALTMRSRASIASA